MKQEPYKGAVLQKIAGLNFIVGAILLVAFGILQARIDLADGVERIQQERQHTEQLHKRLGKAYLDGLYSDDDYRREKRELEEKLTGLVVPRIDAARSGLAAGRPAEIVG